jgi:PIN domain of ribonuclease
MVCVLSLLSWVRPFDPIAAIQFAKTTGDYAVLSHADLCLVALTYALHKQAEDAIKKAPEDVGFVLYVGLSPQLTI